MPRPLIGITCGTSALDPHAKNPQDRLNRAYSHAVEMAGGVPVIIPNTPGLETDVLGRIDGLLLSGGYDVYPTVYGEEPLNETLEIDHDRDTAELPFLRAALASGLPIFAICRGIQTLNIVLGGSLYQDIPAQIPSEIVHRQEAPRAVATHTVTIEPGSCLAATIGDTRMEVNSFHHQALKGVGEGLRVVAAAPDGVIEGVEGVGERFLLGVQCHPEEMVDSSAHARRLFEVFVRAAARG